MLYQRTIKTDIELEGTGLHTGRPAGMVLCPAPPDTGIVLISGGVRVNAHIDNVIDSNHATSVELDGVMLRTVEHLLAALAGLWVDNVFVELKGHEVPIMDGSAWPFIKAIRAAGLKVQDAHRRYIKIVKEVGVRDGDRSASLAPATSTRISYRIDFNHPLISDQRYALEVTPESFVEEISRARTFGFLKDVETLRKHGLARGGSLDNAVVIDNGHVMNPEGLRYHDEFVRHKILDAVGDMSLLGMPFIGEMTADKSGHLMHHRLVRELLANPDCFIIFEPGRDQAVREEMALTEAGA